MTNIFVFSSQYGKIHYILMDLWEYEIKPIHLTCETSRRPFNENLDNNYGTGGTDKQIFKIIFG